MRWSDGITASVNMNLSKLRDSREWGAWRAAVHGVTKCLTQLSNWKIATNMWLSSWLSGKEHTYQCRRHKFDPWVGKIPWRRKWQPTSVSLPRNSGGQRSLAGSSPQRGTQLSTQTIRLESFCKTMLIGMSHSFPFLLSCYSDLVCFHLVFF